MGSRAALGVVGGGLMRILAIAQLECPLECGDERLGKRVLALEPARDGCVVGGGTRERNGREALPCVERRRAPARPQLGEHGLVVPRAAHGTTESKLFAAARRRA